MKGFTLIELLVVIAIIAILSVVVVLSLNPAELLRQSRDSNRISDMATLKSAISLYLVDVSSTNLGASNTIFESFSTSTVSTTFNGTSTWGFILATAATTTNAGVRSISGSGWVPVNFSVISSGAPIGQEPIDPINSGNFLYVYEPAATTFKLGAKTESTKFGYQGSADVCSKDGGQSSSTYEGGSNLSL